MYIYIYIHEIRHSHPINRNRKNADAHIRACVRVCTRFTCAYVYTIGREHILCFTCVYVCTIVFIHLRICVYYRKRTHSMFHMRIRVYYCIHSPAHMCIL